MLIKYMTKIYNACKLKAMQNIIHLYQQTEKCTTTTLL